MILCSHSLAERKTRIESGRTSYKKFPVLIMTNYVEDCDQSHCSYTKSKYEEIDVK